MIFVTVGTHEQPFNRLVEYMDKWAGEHDEEVVRLDKEYVDNWSLKGDFLILCKTIKVVLSKDGAW